jgi:hypothetical protein
MSVEEGARALQPVAGVDGAAYDRGPEGRWIGRLLGGGHGALMSLLADDLRDALRDLGGRAELAAVCHEDLHRPSLLRIRTGPVISRSRPWRLPVFISGSGAPADRRFGRKGRAAGHDSMSDPSSGCPHGWIAIATVLG